MYLFQRLIAVLLICSARSFSVQQHGKLSLAPRMAAGDYELTDGESKINLKVSSQVTVALL